ncbi:MAG TPA: hypothetical protein VN611_07365, partial [Patescibacteria group bacterium]|nr:hypothetical protein [Patescibacteria group bacterium]
LYLSSVKYFAEFTAKYQVDSEMSAHGWVDNSFDKMEALRVRKPGEPHPFVIGQEKYREYEQGFIAAAETAIAKLPKRVLPKK